MKFQQYSISHVIVTAHKLDTCLYELIYSEESILPPPKIFTIPLETPCIIHYVNLFIPIVVV